MFRRLRKPEPPSEADNEPAADERAAAVPEQADGDGSPRCRLVPARRCLGCSHRRAARRRQRRGRGGHRRRGGGRRAAVLEQHRRRRLGDHLRQRVTILRGAPVPRCRAGSARPGRRSAPARTGSSTGARWRPRARHCSAPSCPVSSPDGRRCSAAVDAGRSPAALEPAIDLATDGFPVSELLHEMIGASADRLRRWPASARIFLPDGRVPRVGERLVQSDLGRTLEAIARNGAPECTTGVTGRALAEFFGAARRGAVRRRPRHVPAELAHAADHHLSRAHRPRHRHRGSATSRSSRACSCSTTSGRSPGRSTPSTSTPASSWPSSSTSTGSAASVQVSAPRRSTGCSEQTTCARSPSRCLAVGHPVDSGRRVAGARRTPSPWPWSTPTVTPST